MRMILLDSEFLIVLSGFLFCFAFLLKQHTDLSIFVVVSF